MRLSQKLVDFNTEVNDSVPYIAVPANTARLQIAASQVTDTGTLLGTWNTAYGVYITPATHTPAAVADANTAYANLHTEMQGIKRQLKANRAITLTGPDYAAIHMHQDAVRRDEIPAPAFAPSNQLLLSTHLVNKIFSLNPTSGHERETKLPTDVGRVGRKLAVVPFGSPAPAPEQYHALEDIGATVYNIVFAAEQVGATAYLITYYCTPAGKQGPPSAPLSFQII